MYHLLLYHDILYFFAGDTDCSQDECHEGASDVISRSSLLRIVLFFLIIFLISGCTIVVMVSGMIKNMLSQITSTTSCYWTKSLPLGRSMHSEQNKSCLIISSIWNYFIFVPVYYWFILLLFVCMHPDKEINVLEIFNRLGGSSIAVVGSCSCNITHNSHNCV